MRFYVIYSFDCTKNSRPEYYYPPYVEEWNQTEDDDEWEYNYLADENPENKDFWANGHHRKFVREMNKTEFLHFIRETGLAYEDVETLGSITELGWLPAFSFSGEGMSIYDAEGLIYIGAYVTPIPEPVRPLFSVRHNQEGFGWVTDEDLEKYAYKKQHKYWNFIQNAFREAS
jgi:hypothetical protein